MMFWLALLALTAAAIAVVATPLFRARANAKRADYDVAVYKDQLREVERDRVRGVMDDAAAEAAKLEIERRLLAAASQDDATDAQSVSRPMAWRWTIVLALLLTPGAALIYLDHGVPGMPGAPHAERVAQSDARAADFAQLIAQVEARLSENPDDLRGWVVLARGYARLGRLDDAMRAQARAMDLFDAEPDMAGEAAETSAAFGEVLVDQADGHVTPEARAAFGKALNYDERNARARYFLAMAKMQDGDPKGAVADWKALIADAPDNAPWLADLKAQIEEIEARRGATQP